MTRRLALMLLSLLLPVAAFAQSAPVAPVEGVHYETLANPGTWDKVGKGEIEVAEIFHYTCIHCADLAPKLEAWKATLPKNAKVRYVPAAYGLDDDFARAFFAADSLKVLPRTHVATFEALHADHALPRNATDGEIAAFYATLGIDANRFAAAQKSPQVAARVKAAHDFIGRAQIGGTPTIIVAGRWKVMGRSLDDLLANTAALVRNPPR